MRPPFAFWWENWMLQQTILIVYSSNTHTHTMSAHQTISIWDKQYKWISRHAQYRMRIHSDSTKDKVNDMPKIATRAISRERAREKINYYQCLIINCGEKLHSIIRISIHLCNMWRENTCLWKTTFILCVSYM